MTDRMPAFTPIAPHLYCRTDTIPLKLYQAANKAPKRARRSSASRRGATSSRDQRTSSSIFRGVTKHRYSSTCQDLPSCSALSRIKCGILHSAGGIYSP
jgi:hypothetical protein